VAVVAVAKEIQLRQAVLGIRPACRLAKGIVAVRHTQAPLLAQVAAVVVVVQLLLVLRETLAEQVVAVLVQHLQLADHL
jgi:hypothetical protein